MYFLSIFLKWKKIEGISQVKEGNICCTFTVLNNQSADSLFRAPTMKIY